MKIRQDAWSEENDLLLAETVLRHVREGSTQLNAFEEVGDKLNRTSAACGFRWNAVVRHQYEKALELAKKQRKQRQRMLGKDQSGKKKLLYSPPVPTLNDMEAFNLSSNLEMEMSSFEEEVDNNILEENVISSYQPSISDHYDEPLTTSVNSAASLTKGTNSLDFETVLSYLENFRSSQLQLEIYKSENERLKRELAAVQSRNHELENKINRMESSSETIQEDYETLMKIMNRARKLVLLEEDERPATKFKMDRNGNLEKVAE